MKKVDSVRIYEMNMMLTVRLYFKDDKNDETFDDFYFNDYSDEDEFIEAVEEYLSLKNIEIAEEELKNLKILVSIYYYKMKI
jgi:hypothetical protein